MQVAATIFTESLFSFKNFLAIQKKKKAMSRHPPISIIPAQRSYEAGDDRRFRIRLRENEVIAQELAMAEQQRELERQEVEAALVRLQNTDYDTMWREFNLRNQRNQLAAIDVGEDLRDPEYKINPDGSVLPSPVLGEPYSFSDDEDESTAVVGTSIPFTSLFPPSSPNPLLISSDDSKSEPSRYSSLNQSWQWTCPECQTRLGEFGNVAGNYVCNCDNPTQLCDCGALGPIGAQCSCMNPF